MALQKVPEGDFTSQFGQILVQITIETFSVSRVVESDQLSLPGVVKHNDEQNILSFSTHQHYH